MREKLLREPISKLLLQLAVPASIGVIFNTLFNVVDTYFAGRISTDGLAALSLSFPVFFLVLAFGNGLSTGVTALIGHALGEGKESEAKELASQALVSALGLSLILSLCGIWGNRSLLALLPGQGDFIKDASLYLDWIFAGSVFFILNYTFNGILNAYGDTRSFRNFLIVGFFLNVGLDPWFIYGGLGIPALGLKGVALATILIQAMGCFYLLFRLCWQRFHCFSWKKLFPDKKIIQDILKQGLPAGMSMLTVSIGIFIINYFVSPFGKEAVAAYGAGVRIEQLALLPAIGLNTATLTLTARNFGAGLFKRVEEIRQRVLSFCLWLIPGSLIVMGLASFLMQLFSQDPRVVEMGAIYIRIDALVFYAYMLLFSQIAVLQGMKKPFYALIMGLSRQIIAPLLLFPIFIYHLNLGLSGVWWGIVVVVWTAAIITFFFVRARVKKLIL